LNLKHASSRLLYAYWNERRGDRAAPERGDIEPGGLRRALGDSFVLAYDTAGDHTFRIAGTRICGLFGRELRGETFAALWQTDDTARMGELVGIVADEGVGVVAGATGRTAEGYSVEVELMLLPLRHRGNTHARQIGVLAPLVLPYWLGSSPVEWLTLGAHRHIGMEADEIMVPGRFSSLRGARSRHGFVVYDGGRSNR
jgi:hypothetical protein